MRRFLLLLTVAACLLPPLVPLRAADDAAQLRRQDEDTRRSLADKLKTEERARDEQGRAWTDQVKRHQEELRRLEATAKDAEERRRTAVHRAQEEEKRLLEQRRAEDAARQRQDLLKQEAERQAIVRRSGEDYAKRLKDFADQDAAAGKRLESDWRSQGQALDRQARDLESRGLREAARLVRDTIRAVEEDVRQQADRQRQTEQWYKSAAQRAEEDRRRGEAQWRQSLAEHDERAARTAAERQRTAAQAEADARAKAAEAEARAARDRQAEDQRRADEIRRLQEEQRRLYGQNRAGEAQHMQSEVERRDAERRHARDRDQETELERLRKQLADGKADWTRQSERRRQDIRRKQDEMDWLEKLGLRDAAKVAREEARRLEDALRAEEDRHRTEHRQLEDAISRLETARRTPEPPLPAVTPPPSPPAPTPPVPAPVARSWCGDAAPCDEALAATAYLGVCLFAQPAETRTRREIVPCADGAAGVPALPLKLRWGSDNSLTLSSGLALKFDRRRGSARFSDGQTARVESARISFSSGLTAQPQGTRALRYSNGVTLAWDSRGRLRWDGLPVGPVTLWLEKGGAVFGTGAAGSAGWPCGGRSGDPSLCPRVLTEMALLAGASFVGGAGQCSRDITVQRVPGFRPVDQSPPAGDRLSLGNGLTAIRTGPADAACSSGVTSSARDGGVAFSTGVTARLDGPGRVLLSNGLRVTVEANGRARVSE